MMTRNPGFPVFASIVRQSCKPGLREQQRGQATIEYTVIVVAFIGVLIADPDVFVQLMQAVQSVYQDFTVAIGAAWLP